MLGKMLGSDVWGVKRPPIARWYQSPGLRGCIEEAESPIYRPKPEATNWSLTAVARAAEDGRRYNAFIRHFDLVTLTTRTSNGLIRI